MEFMSISFIFTTIVVVVALVTIAKTLQIVPQQTAYVVERLGKYSRTLDAGLHILIPFIDRVRSRHSLTEVVLDIPAQICITKDNVQVNIDGVLFFRVIDVARATYGVSNYEQAIVQLSQTTLRSEIGKIDLDRTFEEREKINNAVIMSIDHATDPWGVKVLRYEIKSINPPRDVLDAMEKQMRAEREKRAKILESEADRDSKINRAEGIKQETIKNSEADRMKQINEAEGKAAAIFSVAKATADGLNLIAISLNAEGGQEAARLRVAEEYVREFGKMASDANTIIIPANTGDVSNMIVSAFSILDRLNQKNQK